MDWATWLSVLRLTKTRQQLGFGLGSLPVRLEAVKIKKKRTKTRQQPIPLLHTSPIRLDVVEMKTKLTNTRQQLELGSGNLSFSLEAAKQKLNEDLTATHIIALQLAFPSGGC